MAKGELQGRGRQVDLMPGAHFLDPAGALQDLRGCRFVIVVGPLDRTRGQDPGVEGPPDNDADLLFRAERQQLVRGFLFEQGVASSQEKTVEITRPRAKIVGAAASN